jgi:hypothetical protein
MRKTTIRLAATCVLAAVLALGTVGAAHAQDYGYSCFCPLRTDDNCIVLGKSGIGSPYWWGHAFWRTTDRDYGGSDCSGFVIKAWQVPRNSAIGTDYHPYGTWDIFNQRWHWYPVGRSTAARADAVGYPDPDGGGDTSGHVVMYETGSAYGQAYVQEATPPRIVRHWRNLSGSLWRVRRRHNMIVGLGL